MKTQEDTIPYFSVLLGRSGTVWFPARQEVFHALNQTHGGLFNLSQPWIPRCCQSLRFCWELPCDKML